MPSKTKPAKPPRIKYQQATYEEVRDLRAQQEEWEKASINAGREEIGEHKDMFIRLRDIKDQCADLSKDLTRLSYFNLVTRVIMIALLAYLCLRR